MGRCPTAKIPRIFTAPRDIFGKKKELGFGIDMVTVASCIWSFAAMWLASGVWAGQDDLVQLPSGDAAYVQEILSDRPGEGLVYRFRFVSPTFRADADRLELVMADLAFLCTEVALPKVPVIGPQPSRLIISLGARESVFGVHNPEITQVFEVFSIENGTCIWEEF